MTTIKSFTDISQSKKLAEILPLESADMYYFDDNGGDPNFKVRDGITYYYDSEDCLSCWSLTALLKLLPKSARLEKGNVTELYRVILPVELEASDWYIDPIDACYGLQVSW